MKIDLDAQKSFAVWLGGLDGLLVGLITIIVAHSRGGFIGTGGVSIIGFLLTMVMSCVVGYLLVKKVLFRDDDTRLRNWVHWTLFISVFPTLLLAVVICALVVLS
jgi:hypothetical protein